jgi:Uncharacterized membrane protein
MPSELELAVRLVAALVLGGAIGFEREVTGQVAGLRTHMCVALGAALFAIVSAFGFDEFVRPRVETNLQVDVSRVASNIVTGIGFLGGGAIIKEGATVKGLTTAASLWVTAAVGSAVAMGDTRWPPCARWPSSSPSPRCGARGCGCGTDSWRWTRAWPSGCAPPRMPAR